MATREAVAVFAAAVLLYCVWKRRWAWILAGILSVTVVDPLCSRLIKPMVGRDRPCRALAEVDTPGGHCGAALAMPSVHAADTAAIAAATRSPLLVGVSLVTGVSRVVAGQHWPTDVVVGWLIGGGMGAGIGTAVRAGVRRVRRRRGIGASPDPR